MDYEKLNTVTLMGYVSKIEDKLKARGELLFPSTAHGNALHETRKSCLSELRSRGISV